MAMNTFMNVFWYVNSFSLYSFPEYYIKYTDGGDTDLILKL